MSLLDHCLVIYWSACLIPTGHFRIMLNSTVKSLKVDTKTSSVYGSIDEGYDDPVTYDHVVMAADVGAVQSILNNTYANYRDSDLVRTALDNSFNASIAKMKIAPDYKVLPCLNRRHSRTRTEIISTRLISLPKVLRIWFNKQLNASAPDILETPDFTPINLIAQYHLLEEEFIVWANETGGSVMEFQ